MAHVEGEQLARSGTEKCPIALEIAIVRLSTFAWLCTRSLHMTLHMITLIGRKRDSAVAFLAIVHNGAAARQFPGPPRLERLYRCEFTVM